MARKEPAFWDQGNVSAQAKAFWARAKNEFLRLEVYKNGECIRRLPALIVDKNNHLAILLCMRDENKEELPFSAIVEFDPETRRIIGTGAFYDDK
jgi:hypothetical protein